MARINTHKISTSMKLAFQNIKVAKSAYTPDGAKIGAQIYNSNASGYGIINRPDWNAHLSLKTAKLLNAPEFNVNNHYGSRNAYDCMVAG